MVTATTTNNNNDRWAVEEAGALDLDAANANGCTVAHWASSGGDEAVCRYAMHLLYACIFGRRHRVRFSPMIPTHPPTDPPTPPRFVDISSNLQSDVSFDSGILFVVEQKRF